MYEFTRTGQLLPILLGTSMDDAAGTDMLVPILGIEHDKQSGSVRPLGGTMEDLEGQGKVFMNKFVYLNRFRLSTCITTIPQPITVLNIHSL